jgi:hypothetical protein
VSEKKKRFLGKVDILGQQDIVTEELFVPEWDAWVTVKMLTAAERDYFEASTVRREGKKTTLNLQGIRARLCALCLVDETGQRIFGEEDEYALGTKSAAALDRVFRTAQRLNGLDDGQVEEMVKNSEGDQRAVLDSD